MNKNSEVIKGYSKWMFAIFIVALFISGFYLVSYYIGEEPFVKFRPLDAWLMLVGSTTLIILWVGSIIFVIYTFYWKNTKISVLVLVLLIAFFNLFWIAQIPYLYIAETEEFISIRKYNCYD